jgi:hypothetical protein
MKHEKLHCVAMQSSWELAEISAADQHIGILMISQACMQKLA